MYTTNRLMEQQWGHHWNLLHPTCFQYTAKVNGLQIVHNNKKLQFYHRYVDDIFVIFKKKDHAKKFLRYINFHYRNSSVKKKTTTGNCFQTFPSVEIITHWKHLSSVNLHLVTSSLVLIVSYQKNVKEVCCTRCYVEHIAFVPAICRFMKKSII